MFAFNSDITATPCEPGVSRKVLTYSDELMMCEIHFEKGAQGNTHSHKHLQITYIAKGVFEFTIGDETKVVREGDSVYMPSGVSHGVVCLEEGILVDVFNPKRDEFIH
ncbi:MAG TPA: cupin domain-containing protein [Eubacterium sp.]|jgi:quercetin dioxygenase-like cupin family protein|nr:cupin domain-containing protein [Eubacterium sp.]